MMFRINPNSSLRNFSFPLFFFYIILYPISWFSSFVSNMLMKMFGIKIVSKSLSGISMGELDAYIQENIDRQEDDNKEVEREVKIFQNALEIGRAACRERV